MIKKGCDIPNENNSLPKLMKDNGKKDIVIAIVFLTVGIAIKIKLEVK